MSGPHPVHAPEALTAGDLVNLEKLRWLTRKSSVRGTGLVLHAWATIAVAMTVLLAKGYGGRMELSPGYLDVIRVATARPTAKPRS